jgi:magnesium transporter
MNDDIDIIEQTLAPAIVAKDVPTIRDTLVGLDATEIANLISETDSDEQQMLMFRALPRDLATDVFEYLPYVEQSTLLESLATGEVAAILNEMADDDRTRLFEDLPDIVTNRLLGLLTFKEREKAIQLLGYPEDSVGRLMTPHYIAVKPTWTVQRVLDHIRRNGKDSETLTMIYIVDQHGKLIDDIRMRSFLLAPLENRVADLMNNRFVRLQVTDSEEDAVSIFREADLPALPVTDSEGYLIGVVTYDDILDVAEQEATEDIQKFGGLEALELPYADTPVLTLLRKRAPWLVVLLLGQTFTASAMGYFESEIAQAVVLALFIPLIISSGGNSGSQAATLVIRAMALKELTISDWWLVMRREILTGVALGFILGVLGFLRIAIWHLQGFADYTVHWPLVAFTIFLSLVGIVLWGTISGSMIPFVLQRLGLDPAVSSAPFVATLVDVTGVLIYLSIAAFVLRGTLL